MSDGKESLDIWESIAGWWDDKIGSEGNAFHRNLIEPAELRLLDLKTGETVLDIGCGNGQMARRMALEGVEVEAFDGTEAFIERAKIHGNGGGKISYQVMDATNEQAMLGLGKGKFDKAVSTMVLMDIPEIEPLFAALSKLLKPGGTFVLSIMHPMFNGPGKAMQLIEDMDDPELRAVPYFRVEIYKSEVARKGIGIQGQPHLHWYYHRPLESYMQTAFRHGFVVDGWEEVTFPKDSDAPVGLNWHYFCEGSPVWVARFRHL